MQAGAVAICDDRQQPNCHVDRSHQKDL
jgi:hypothetical protein